ncbi:MAG: ABC-2 family transporter protein [Pseudomonadota bacterium]
MIRFARLIRQFFGNGLQIEMEYRGEFVISALNSLLAFGSGFIVLYAVFHNVSELGGWAFEEGLILFGVFLIIEGYIAMFLQPNLSRLSEYIRLGTMDFILLKPINSQFFVSFRFINIWAFPSVLLGLGLVFYGMWALDALTIPLVAQFLLLLAPALVIVYAVWCVLNTTAFWWTQVENINLIFRTFFEAGRFPVTAYPRWLQILLTAVVPVAFMTTVPAQAAFSEVTLEMALLSWAVAIFALFLCHLFWRYALSKYSSASS